MRGSGESPSPVAKARALGWGFGVYGFGFQNFTARMSSTAFPVNSCLKKGWEPAPQPVLKNGFQVGGEGGFNGSGFCWTQVGFSDSASLN